MTQLFDAITRLQCLAAAYENDARKTLEGDASKRAKQRADDIRVVLRSLDPKLISNLTQCVISPDSYAIRVWDKEGRLVYERNALPDGVIEVHANLSFEPSQECVDETTEIDNAIIR